MEETGLKGESGAVPCSEVTLVHMEKTSDTDEIHVADDMRTLSVEQMRDSGGLSRAMPKKVRRSRQIKEVFY